MVVNSDFKDGVINIGTSTTSYATTESGATTDSLVRLAGSKDKLSFIVDEEAEKLLCVYNGDTLDVETEKVKVKDKTITSGDSLAGRRLSCDRGDTTDVYSFYDGTYMLSHVVGDSANFKAELKLWPKDKTDVLVSGIPQKPLSVTWQGKAIPFEWYPEHQALVLKLVGKGTLKVN